MPKQNIPNRNLKQPSRKPGKNNKQPNNNWLIYLALGFIFLMLMSQPKQFNGMNNQPKMTYGEFYSRLENNKESGDIQEVKLIENVDTSVIEGKLKDGSMFTLNIPREDKELLGLLRENVPSYEVAPAQTFWSQIIISLLPILIIILFIWFISYRGSQVGNKLWSFGKSKAKISNKENNPITFKDVAGVDEAKEELQEVIEFLKDPKKFTRLGGKIPKGVLLVGPPGTGKTLLAKAVAGEAAVPFYSLSGSDFVEMFVGVGASRVRDLFEQGRKASKVSGKGCIIFIDEIDAVGRLRFAGIGGGNDEREQTLNALLVEMDGFNGQTGLILIAATNRPDTLDPALLRPGRFDRRVTVGLPDIIGREGVLKVHTSNIKLAKDVNLRKIAQQTVYFSGADLANVCNEAALLAARFDKESVEQKDFLHAVERVTMGPEKKSRSVSANEKSMTAYHEAGHALLSLLIDEVDTFSKVSIIPRGMAGGYTLTPPTEDKHYFNKNELQGLMCVLLGGLIGEELHLNVTSTGVSNDLERVTKIARSMVCDYGMSKKLGTLAYGHNDGQGFLGRDIMKNPDYSGKTANDIDEEVRGLVNIAYDRAKKLLSENKDKLDLLANRLIEKEVIDIDEVLELFGMEPIKNQDDDQPILTDPEKKNESDTDKNGTSESV